MLFQTGEIFLCEKLIEKDEISFLFLSLFRSHWNWIKLYKFPRGRCAERAGARTLYFVYLRLPFRIENGRKKYKSILKLRRKDSLGSSKKYTPHTRRQISHPCLLPPASFICTSLISQTDFKSTEMF